MRVAFQGEPGAYSEQAVFEYFGEVETVPCEFFDAMFDSVASGKSDAALAPIEQSPCWEHSSKLRPAPAPFPAHHG